MKNGNTKEHDVLGCNPVVSLMKHCIENESINNKVSYWVTADQRLWDKSKTDLVTVFPLSGKIYLEFYEEVESQEGRKTISKIEIFEGLEAHRIDMSELRQIDGNLAQFRRHEMCIDGLFSQEIRLQTKEIRSPILLK